MFLNRPTVFPKFAWSRQQQNHINLYLNRYQGARPDKKSDEQAKFFIVRELVKIIISIFESIINLNEQHEKKFTS